jgi:hypothetical protein
MQAYTILLFVLVCGAIGGLVNAFIGDNGFHLPKVTNDVWQPGWIGVVVIGAVAAAGSWASLKAVTLWPAGQGLTLQTSDLANALIIGFGGAKWFKSESDKDIWQKTAAEAASKQPDAQLSVQIAGSTPAKALAAVRSAK